MNNQPRTPSRASTIASQDSKSNAQHAALSGATKAFGRPPPQQRTSADSKKGGNGALAAAAKVGSRQSSPQGPRSARSPAPPAPSSTGGSIQSSRNNGMYTRPTLGTSGAPNLQPTAPDRRQHSKSPSLQAASFAASRATPQPQQGSVNDRKGSNASFAAASKPAAPPKPRRLSTQQLPASNEAAERPTDDTPIPPTTSLVKLFEKKRGSQSESPAKRPDPIVIKPGADMTIKSPKPVRTSGGLTSVFQMELADVKARDETTEDVVATPDFDSSPDSFASASEVVTAPSSPETTMKDRASQQQAQPVPKTAFPHPTIEKQPPPFPSSTRKATAKPVPIKAPDARPSSAMSDRLSPSSASVKSVPAQFNQRYPRGRPPQMTGDQLANAMVASSLASSRGPSPQRSEAPPVPSRRHRHHTLGFSRTPSPAKAGLRQTLRKEASDEDSEEDLLHPYSKHKKKRHLRKHPNKHNEGNRKRWRDAVTERERKRYEGVWAANKGLHCSFTPSEQSFIDHSSDSEEARSLKMALSEQISNIVAREIWSRSRLPEATLETVWYLVDNECVGRLTKDEFVVGMFLIDYCLKGRKLPAVKVSESVWASVRGLQGIKVRK